MSDQSIRPRTEAELMEIKTYRARLKAHDWWYMMSDDARVNDRGEKDRRELRQLAAKLDPDRAIWNEYAPKGSGM